jgi:hypothetical protein
MDMTAIIQGGQYSELHRRDDSALIVDSFPNWWS